MSEEKKCFKKKVLTALTCIALVLSTISIILDGVILYQINSAGSPNKPVVISKQYDKGQTMEKALKTEKPMIVWFYTDWCGFCQRFAPTFGKITKDWKIKKNFAVAYINADYPENADLMQEYQVQGFPTVYLVNPKTGEKEHVDNGKLFAPDAKVELTKDFLRFAKVTKTENTNKAEEEKADNK